MKDQALSTSDNGPDNRPLYHRQMVYYPMVALFNVHDGSTPQSRIAALQSAAPRDCVALRDCFDWLFQAARLAKAALERAEADRQPADPDAPYHAVFGAPTSSGYTARPATRAVPERGGTPALNALVAAIPADGSGRGFGLYEVLRQSYRAVLVLAGFHPDKPDRHASSLLSAGMTMEGLVRAVPGLEGRYLAEFALELVTQVEAALLVAEYAHEVGAVRSELPSDIAEYLGHFTGYDLPEGATMMLDPVGPRLPGLAPSGA